MSRWVNAVYSQRHICTCDYGVLIDSIPLGTIYEVDLDTIADGYNYFCGWCGKKTENVQTVVTRSHSWGRLPLALFTLPSD